MITIIFAPPRTGKTCFLAHMANLTAFDRTRNKAMKNEIINKNINGFNLSIPRHCVSANFDIICHKFGYSPRFSRKINPYRLGFSNPLVETHFNIPYESIFITEAQKYLNSRMSAYFPDWQSRWYEQHGHNNLDIWLDTQRPMLIDVNIRELARFIEIISLKLKHDKYKKVKQLTWTIRIIENSSLFDRYMQSGKKDKTCYTEEKIVANYNVFDCYDSQNCKPKFYENHFNSDFDYAQSTPTEETIEGYKKYLLEHDDELPENFYQRRKAS